MRNLKYFLYILCSVLFMLLSYSCKRDDFAGISTDNGVNIVISVDNFGKKTVTRADNPSDRDDFNGIGDINVILTDGTNILKVFYVDNVDNFDNINTNPTESTTGLIDNNPIQYHISKNDMKDVTDIYVYGNLGKDYQSEIGNNKMTIEQFYANLKIVNIGSNNKTPLFCKAERDIQNQDSHAGTMYNASLKRLISMVTVQMKADGKLNTGVTVHPISIRLCNIPSEVKFLYPDDTNKAIDGNLQQGVIYPVEASENWGKLGNSDADDVKKTVGGHSSEYQAMYMFENMQGTSENSNTEHPGPGGEYTEQIVKYPPTGKENFCTYLEIEATYTYDSAKDVSNKRSNFIVGTIKYRLYLGKDITNNFDVERNTHYRVTLTLTGMGGLREDGRIDEHGNFIAENKDLSWRVDTEKVSEGGSFIGDELNVATNGFYAYVPFKMEEGKKYIIVHEGASTVSWMQTYNDTYKWSSPNDYQATQYLGKDLNSLGVGLNLNPDLYYIKLYVQTWDSSEWPKIDNMSGWIDKGYRSGDLVLYEESSGSPDNERGRLTVKQWLPMPVFENGGNNPLNADMYISRIDVYEGVNLPWGPEEMNNKDLRKLNTKGLVILDRDFDLSYGFDKTLAIYQNEANTDKLIKYNQDEGRPNDALRVAIFRALNALPAQIEPKFPNPSEYEQFRKIGLPTVTEWEKVKQYGTIDPKFPIAPEDYWTSDIDEADGTKSKVFSYYGGSKGSSRAEVRSNKHRVRLIYHKNDYATSTKY